MELDHIVIGATTLDQGRAYVQDVLGVDVPLGGQHTHMGTHNRLMGLGGRTYFEIIAIDPTLDAPNRPRWFSLDDAAMRARLRARPHLIAWVAGSPDLAATCRAATVNLGSIATLRRDDLSWQMAVPDDGALIEGGGVPIVIEWPIGVHPSSSLPDLGCRLEGLTVRHPDPDRLLSLLDAIDAQSLVQVSVQAQPGLAATVRRADGRVVVLD